MKKRYFAFIIVVLSALFSCNIYGVETESIPLTLEILNNSNQSNINDRFYFEMVPEDENNPMPEGTENGVYSLTLTNEGNSQIPSMEFNEVGDYVYHIYQVENNNKLYSYDNTIYTLVVSVINDENMDELEVYSIITKEDNNEKYNEFYFTNTYIQEPTVDVNTSDIDVKMLCILSIFSLIALNISIKKIVLNK